MLQIESLHQIFNPGSINEVHSLRGIDLHLPSKQFVTVIGSNGAGKSTLFNVISGVFPPTKGSIKIDGEDVSQWAEHKRADLIGRVFQDPLKGTASSMTIAENLTMAMLRTQRLRLRLGVNRARRAKLGAMLAPLELGLEERLDDQVSLLSGGQRQAMTLIMASLSRPKILLLDEHTAALDPGTARRILDLTNEIVGGHQLTTLMITHNMQQALTFGDRTLMLHSGKIVLDIDENERKGMTIQNLIDKFSTVALDAQMDDELLLST